MPCTHVKLPNGDYAIVCTRDRLKVEKCVTCNRPATLLCDYQVKRNGRAGTCDRHICARCSESQGPEKDYCLAHAALAPKQAKQEELF
jgi:hypothetical protein